MTMIVGTLEDELYAAVITAFKLSELPPGDDKDSATAAYRVLAVELSTAIDKYIKSATVTVNTTAPAVRSVVPVAVIPTPVPPLLLPIFANVISMPEIIKSTGDLT